MTNRPKPSAKFDRNRSATWTVVIVESTRIGDVRGIASKLTNSDVGCVTTELAFSRDLGRLNAAAGYISRVDQEGLQRQRQLCQQIQRYIGGAIGRIKHQFAGSAAGGGSIDERECLRIDSEDVVLLRDPQRFTDHDFGSVGNGDRNRKLVDVTGVDYT